MRLAYELRGGELDTHEISLGRCFSEGWEAFKQNAGLAIGSSLLAMVISGAAGQTGVGGVLASFPLAGGLCMIYLGIVKGLNPEFPTLFAGFTSVDNWARWLGVGWLLCLYQMLVFLACAIPGGICIGLGIFLICAHASVAGGVVLIILGCLITMVTSMAITVRWVFVFLAGAEGATAFDAIRISTELTEGLRFRIFWILFALGLLNLAGMLCCFIGIIFTQPITECAICALYLDVKQLKAQPVTRERPIE